MKDRIALAHAFRNEIALDDGAQDEPAFAAALEVRDVLVAAGAQVVEDKHFVAVGGSIKDMESILGISYPTVKKRLAELADALGVGHRFPRPDPKRTAAERLRLLEMLSAGEMTAEEVSQKFEELTEEEE